jgi:tetratricopeptide (TPR) repeat protein
MKPRRMSARRSASVRDAFACAWLTIAGAAKLCLREYEEAVAWLRRSIEANRNYTAHFWLAAALAHLGRIEEAQSAAKAGLVLDPTRTIRSWRARNAGGHPAFLAQQEHIFDECAWPAFRKDKRGRFSKARSNAY